MTLGGGKAPSRGEGRGLSDLTAGRIARASMLQATDLGAAVLLCRADNQRMQRPDQRIHTVG